MSDEVYSLVYFTPIGRPDVGTVCARPNYCKKGEYVFEVIDFEGRVQILTYHANFPDALEQCVRRMRLNPEVQWNTELPL